MFDYNKTNGLSFIEFLLGIAKFTKLGKVIQIKTLFEIYDPTSKKFIDEEEFMKMLYNYPQENLKELFEETRMQVLTGNMTMDESPYLNSMMDIVQKDEPQVVLQKRNSIIINRKNSMDNLDQRNLGKFNKRIPPPTSVNNKLKKLTRQIFQKYGRENRLNLEGFTQWIELHPRFLNMMRNWFRPNLWEIYFDEKKNLNLKRLNQQKPTLSLNLKIQNYKSFTKTPAYAQIFDTFLFIFKNDDQNELPLRIHILKGLNISFNDTKQKIYLTHNYKTYQGIKLKFNTFEDYSQWKKYMELYSEEYKLNKYEILQRIGKGKFSSVYLVQNKKDKKQYALKQIMKQELTQQEKIVLENETKIMKVLNHENVVQFFESWETIESHNYILEYIKGQDLYSFIEKNGPQKESIALEIMKKLLKALQSIHQQGIIHRDLKLDNIIVTVHRNEIKQLKLIDFGFSIFEEELKPDTPRAGTPGYIAPEIFLQKPYSKKVDVFALGVIMFFILSESLPFNSDENEVIISKTVEGNYDLNDSIFETVSEDAKDLIKNMLEHDQSKRFTVEQCLKHVWIENKNYQADQNHKKQIQEEIKQDDNFNLDRFVQFNLIMFKGKIFQKILKFSQQEVKHFGILSNDTNLIHYDDKYASNTIFKKPIVQGMLVASQFGGLIGSNLKNVIYLNQDIQFKKPVYIEELILCQVEIVRQNTIEKGEILELDTKVYKLNENKEKNILAVEGKAKVLILKAENQFNFILKLFFKSKNKL